jgi:hypothetical protein
MSNKRIGFLKKRFNVFSDDALLEFNGNIEDGVIVVANHYTHYTSSEKILLISFDNDKGKAINYFSDNLFNVLSEADPTSNKIYLQWLLNLSITKAYNSNLITFYDEDLEKMFNNLTLFDSNKRKRKFKELCSKNYATKNLNDPLNINQYESDEQLHNAVFPFKETIKLSELESTLIKFEEMGQAEIPVKNDKFTIFIPKTLAASEIFSFAHWCTSLKGNSMFKTYRDYKRFNDKGKLKQSDLFIVIDNNFFKGENKNIYQIHFESNQIMDVNDKVYEGLYRDIISKDISVKNFFFETLKNLYINNHGKEGEFVSTYKKHIIEYNFTNILFDVLDLNIRSLVFRDIKMKNLPNLNRFGSLRIIFLDNVGLTNLGDSDFSLIEGISVPKNNLTFLPDISKAKNLKFLNIKNNPIKDVSNNIKFLDSSNGGSLEMLSMDILDGDDIYSKLKKLLPNVHIC